MKVKLEFEVNVDNLNEAAILGQEIAGQYTHTTNNGICHVIFVGAKEIRENVRNRGFDRQGQCVGIAGQSCRFTGINNGTWLNCTGHCIGCQNLIDEAVAAAYDIKSK